MKPNERLDWLNDFDAVDDEKSLCEMLAGCGDELPPDVCESLELPIGSSFGDAAANRCFSNVSA